MTIRWLTQHCSGFFINVTAIRFLIQLNRKMSFNSSLDLMLPKQPENGPKFPRFNSKASMNTQPELYLESEIAGRKITLEQKEMFIDLITKQNFSMKQASKITAMSYSSAKKVFSRFRQTLHHRNSKNRKEIKHSLQCSFSQLPQGDSAALGHVQLISTIAGRRQFKNDRQ